jgi:hypothetical protein
VEAKRGFVIKKRKLTKQESYLLRFVPCFRKILANYLPGKLFHTGYHQPPSIGPRLHFAFPCVPNGWRVHAEKRCLYMQVLNWLNYAKDHF